MDGEPIRELNVGLVRFLDEVWLTHALKESLDLAIIRFAETVEVVRPMNLLSRETIRALSASGGTPLGGALRNALAMIDCRQKLGRLKSEPLTRPWIIVMTDGQPTDEWKSQAWRVKTLATMRELSVLAIGIGPAADMGMLSELTSPDLPPMRLKGLRFTDFFKWLGKSLELAANSNPGERLALPHPSDWSEGRDPSP
jgi:uncharacterized protein YegL